jgi:hypothetical protein
MQLPLLTTVEKVMMLQYMEYTHLQQQQQQQRSATGVAGFADGQKSQHLITTKTSSRMHDSGGGSSTVNRACWQPGTIHTKRLASP